MFKLNATPAGWRMLQRPLACVGARTPGFPACAPVAGSVRYFAYEDTFAYRVHGPKPFVLVIHPVLPGEKRRSWPEILFDAEEAIALARARRLDILPGPGGEPRGGWDLEAFARAEELQEKRQRLLEDRTALVPEGWHLDRGDDESDEEYDIDEEAWKNPILRSQWAETCVVRIRHIDVNTFFGRGKVNELALHAAANHPVNMVFVNAPLTPNQASNLELVFRNAYIAADTRQRREENRYPRSKQFPTVQIWDRTRMLLELFHHRAKTSHAKCQVAIARLEYLRTRLGGGFKHRVKETVHMLQEYVGPFHERLGVRNDVEVQFHYENVPFETERHLLKLAEKRFQKMLQIEKNTRRLQSKNREGVPLIGIVGYTNVGKTSLMNCLTRAGLKERDLLFETLDTTMRRVRLPSGGHGIVVDSIGFLQKLPHNLFCAFELTLRELAECDVLLHVRDTSCPQWEMHKEVVIDTLQKAGLPDSKIHNSMVEVWNKIDLVPPEQLTDFLDAAPQGVMPVCASDGAGVEGLLQVVDAVINVQIDRQRRTVAFPEDMAGKALRFLHANGTVNDESMQVAENGSVIVEAVLPQSAWARWSSVFIEG